MNFTDIHTHILFGVDDGPGNAAQMEKMLELSYADGVRCICATPHFHPGLFPNTPEQIRDAFAQLREYAARKFPDMRLCLGNEVRYNREIISWLQSGACLTLNGTKQVLVDFSAMESEDNIVRAVERLLNAGYSPVLAHVERYGRLSAQAARDMIRNGVWLQADAGSFFGAFGTGPMYRSRAMLRARLLDVVASDIHDARSRSTVMRRAYELAVKKCDKAYADLIFCDNPRHLLESNDWEESELNYER